MWLVNAPPVDRLEEPELSDVRRAATRVACALRSIRQFTIGVADSGGAIGGLLEGILPEMENAATQILRDDRNSVGTALWAVQMACERALKAYCQQQTSSFRETHDLFVLFDDASRHGLISDRSLLRSLPRSKDLVDSRYGLGPARSVQNAIEIYSAGLSLVSAVTKSLKREITIAGGGVLLKMAPWIALPKTPGAESD